MAPIERVAFLGLGIMGAPMARHLSQGGFDVIVWNRTAERARAFAGDHGARLAATPAEAAQARTPRSRWSWTARRSRRSSSATTAPRAG